MRAQRAAGRLEQRATIPPFSVYYNSAGWRGVFVSILVSCCEPSSKSAAMINNNNTAHGTKEGRSAGHLAPPLPMLLYICNKCIYMSEAGKPRRYWARRVEMLQKRWLMLQKRWLMLQKRWSHATKKMVSWLKCYKKDGTILHNERCSRRGIKRGETALVPAPRFRWILRNTIKSVA